MHFNYFLSFRKCKNDFFNFVAGFKHRSNSKGMDLNKVRLCFQAFLIQKGSKPRPLKPVVSETISDKKSKSDLIIFKISDLTSYPSGGKHIILLCEKVVKEDINVRFFEQKDDEVIWEAFGIFEVQDVHRQVAISFKTPKYRLSAITKAIKVFVQLQRPSDLDTSEPLPFEYIPG